MSSADPRLKKIKIQTGVVKRCGKEKLSYRKEANQQKEKLEKFKKEGKDDMEIKKMNEQVQESLMMIPDCHRRLEKAVKELKNLVSELEVDFPLSEILSLFLHPARQFRFDHVGVSND